MHAEFTLSGADGEDHRYIVAKPHDPIVRGKGVSGLRLVQSVTRAAAAPLVNLVDSNAAKLIEFVVEQGKEGNAVSANDLMTMFDENNIEAIGDSVNLTDAFGHFADAIQQADMAEVLPKVMYHTSRDGQPLKVEDNFNSAYAGNYWELVKASYNVCRINGFFGSLATQVSSEADPVE